jgi:fucose 4-O-acetylase-like acetyltransferase
VSELRPRDESLDALRAATTILVVFHHTSITYGGDGSWFYVEVPRSDNLTSNVFSLFTAFNQAWFMGLFFLIAGYFTPGAVERHGALGFLRERALRLGLPLVVFGCVLGPATIALAQTAKGRDFVAVLLRLWGRRLFEPGPLWFAEALLIFAVGYVALKAIFPKRPSPPFPSNRTLLAAALGVAVVGFLIRLSWPTGANLLGLQFGYFPGYVVLFAAGCAASGWPTLDAAQEATRRLWRWVARFTFPVLPVAAILWRPLTGAEPHFSGGWNVPALIYALWEPLLAWGVILALLHGFHLRFSQLGPFGRKLARRAYTIYVIHPPILVGVALVWRAVAAPAFAKFLVTGSAAVALCYFVAGMLLALPGARRVL